MAFPMRHNQKKQPDRVRMAVFSRMCGHAARSTVLRAARRGRVVLTSDGRVDLSNPANTAYYREALAAAAIRSAPRIAEIKEKLNNSMEEI